MSIDETSMMGRALRRMGDVRHHDPSGALRPCLRYQRWHAEHRAIDGFDPSGSAHRHPQVSLLWIGHHRAPLPELDPSPGEAIETVARQKTEIDGPISVIGSGALVRSLLSASLLDGLMLSTFPIVLRRSGGAPCR
jgi:hypothetical protein